MNPTWYTTETLEYAVIVRLEGDAGIDGAYLVMEGPAGDPSVWKFGNDGNTLTAQDDGDLAVMMLIDVALDAVNKKTQG